MTIEEIQEAVEFYFGKDLPNPVHCPLEYGHYAMLAINLKLQQEKKNEIV